MGAYYGRWGVLRRSEVIWRLGGLVLAMYSLGRFLYFKLFRRGGCDTFVT